MEKFNFGLRLSTLRKTREMTFSQWAGMFLPHYGLVVNADTGKIEYEFGATNRDWIRWALERAFDSLSETLTEAKV